MVSLGSCALFPSLSSFAGLTRVEKTLMSCWPSATNNVVAPKFHNWRRNFSTSFEDIVLASLIQTEGRPSMQSTASIFKSVKNRLKVWPCPRNSGVSSHDSDARSNRASTHASQPLLCKSGDDVLALFALTGIAIYLLLTQQSLRHKIEAECCKIISYDTKHNISGWTLAVQGKIFHSTLHRMENNAFSSTPCFNRVSISDS